MKTILSKPVITFLYIVFSFIIVFYSCEKDEENTDSETGTVQFVPGFKDQNMLKSASDIEAYPVDAIVISIESITGTKIFTLKKIPLIKFGYEFVTDPISLKSGEYKITDFMIVDENEQVIYATPKEGSANEGSIEDPLPIHFVVKPNKVLSLSPEVLKAVNANPKSFGYERFSFDVVNSYEFLIGIFTYKDKNKAVSLPGATLTVTGGSEIFYSGVLEATTNSVVVASKKTDYKVQVSLDGYNTYERVFSRNEFRSYTSPDGLPLVVIMERSDEGLLFWNKLGSKTEVTHSEVGPNGVINSSGPYGFHTGLFGMAYFANYWQDFIIEFNGTGICDMHEGCIEFWGRLANANPIITHGSGTWYSFFRYVDISGSYITMSINANNGLSSGGITAAIGKNYNNFSSCGTQMYTNEIPLSDILTTEGEHGWHHYAVVWKDGGLPGIQGGNRHIAVYLDGVLNTTFWHSGLQGDYLPWEPVTGSLKLLYTQGNQGTMSIDNLKIWDYAKNDFSDRYYE